MKQQHAKEIDFLELEKSRSYRMFKSAIKSEKTLYAYKFTLRAFLRYTNLSSYDAIIELHTNKIQELLENWIYDFTDKGIKGKSIRVKLAPVELFLDMNKVVYHKRILHKMLPKDEDELGGHEPFTTEEIKRMLESTKKLRTKAFVHFLASTGIRPGAIIDPILRRKHLKEMPEGCLAVKIYDNSKEGYWAFLTPEARRALYVYFDSRKLNGEVLTDESPIFANEKISQNNYFGYNSFKALTSKLLRSAGITRVKNGKRYNKAANYSFRKRFNTILKINNEINSNIVEKLMAHKNGLDGAYLKPTIEECFNEFKKAIPELTIDSTQRQKAILESKEKQITELQAKESIIQQNMSEIENMKLQMAEIQKAQQKETYASEYSTAMLEFFSKVMKKPVSPKKELEGARKFATALAEKGNLLENALKEVPTQEKALALLKNAIKGLSPEQQKIAKKLFKPGVLN